MGWADDAGFLWLFGGYGWDKNRYGMWWGMLSFVSVRKRFMFVCLLVHARIDSSVVLCQSVHVR